MARDVRDGLSPSPRSWRRSTSTTSAARSSSSRSPSCASTTRPGPSARSSTSARPRSSPPPASRGRWSSSAPARPRRPAICSTRCATPAASAPTSRSTSPRRSPTRPLSRWSTSTPASPSAGSSATSSTTSSASPTGTAGGWSPSSAARSATSTPRRGASSSAGIAGLLGPEDRLLLGTDLVKEPERLEAAYDDSLGVTAEFNKNVLRVLNRELGADFDLDAFEHVARYDAGEARMDIRLRSLAEQTFASRSSTWRSSSPPARRCAPRSRPSSPARGSRRVYAEAGLAMSGWFTDAAGDYALSLLARALAEQGLRGSLPRSGLGRDPRRPPPATAPAPRSARRACRAS